MRLLVDQQLPLALARFPSERGLACHHVSDFGMDAHDDRAIWRFARQENLVIVTKDRDFSLLADHERLDAPRVIWVRLGNCRKAALLAAFDAILPALKQWLTETQPVIEIR